jgi:negative regulator of sigma E activity
VSTSNTEERQEAISDEQLMRYLDGELGDEAEAQLEARLVAKRDDDSDARDKLAGLELVGGLLRESVEEDMRGGDLVDSIMAEIEAGHADELPDSVAALQQTGALQPGDKSPLVGKAAANDNARNIYMVAAAAAAVAAGLWFYSGTPAETRTASLPPAATPAASGLPQPAAETTAEVAPDADDEPAVEIASVDFGSGQAGSVFHISGGDTAASSTTVLWVTDLGDDE